MLARISSPSRDGKPTLWRLSDLAPHPSEGANPGDASSAGHDLEVELPSPPPMPVQTPPYQGEMVEAGGRIEGVIHLGLRAPRMARQDCPRDGTEPQQAVVFLSNIHLGRPHFEPRSVSIAPLTVSQLGGVAERRQCRWRPQLQIVTPVGATIQLVSHDDADFEVAMGDGTSADAPGIGFSGAGARGALAANALGPVYLRESGQLPSAWLFVAHHPYHVLTDSRGYFRLDDVPPGRYELVAWLPPDAALTKAGNLELGTERVARTIVEVRARARTSVSLGAPD